MQLSRFLFLAIDFDGFGNEFRSAFTVAVDILLESLVADVHLTEPCENIIGAMIKIRGDVVLQPLHELLCRVAVGSISAIHALGKLRKDTVHSGENVIPFFLE